jgi:rRNA-processing protein FCF1
LQLKILRTYSAWFEHFNLLFHGSPQETQEKIIATNTLIREWIEKNNGWNVPRSIPEAIKRIQEDFAIYYQLLKVLDTPEQTDTILVPDTNALIICPDITRFKESIGQPNYTVILISTVLGELDKLKRDHRDMDFRKKVDSVIKRIKGFRQQGNMREGITVNKTVTVKMQAEEPNFDETLSWLDRENADDRIIANALELQRKEPSSMVILVTADINYQNKAEAANLPFVEPPASTSNS